MDSKGIFDGTDFCRACLRTEYSLTEITSLDHDSIKFSDKLMACVAEVMWLKDGLPFLICSNCVEQLRVAYDFRNVCLQSHQIFMRYISEIQDENKSERSQVESTSPLEVETKIEVTSTQVVPDTLPDIKEVPLNSPQIHFLVDDDCSVEPEHFIEMGESRNCTPEPEKCINFIIQKQSEPVVDIIDRQHNIEEPNSTEVVQMIQLDQHQQLIHPRNEPQLQHELQQQPSLQNQVFERTTGLQGRPRSPENVPLDSVRSKKYACNICSKSYPYRSGLNSHMQTHKGEKPFHCGFCSKRFFINHQLRVHMRTHTGEKPYSCKTCGKKFSSSGGLHCHVQTHTGRKPFTCRFCGISFSRNSNLSAHMRIHTGEKVRCKVCDDAFTSRYHLRIHMRKHVSKQPYPRAVSNAKQNELQLQHKLQVRAQQKQVVKQKTVVQVQPLLPESVTLDGVQPNSYICKVCGKTCQTSGGLGNHIRTHAGERSLECKYCKKRFYRSFDLGKHIEIHEREKPYQCAVCSKQFSFVYALQRHMKYSCAEQE